MVTDADVASLTQKLRRQLFFQNSLNMAFFQPAVGGKKRWGIFRSHFIRMKHLLLRCNDCPKYYCDYAANKLTEYCGVI